MANSLRTKIKKLYHDRKITEEDMKELIVKLDGHDRELYNNAIDDFSKALLSNQVVDKSVIRRVAEQMKEGERMTIRDEQAIARLHGFIEEFDISCAEDVCQRDSVNEECVDLVAELVEILKGA